VTERMYLVVRSVKQGEKKLDYKLQKHDIIKLGRVKFKVKEIRIKAIEDEKTKKKKKRDKYMKKIQEEEKKQLQVQPSLLRLPQAKNQGAQQLLPLMARS
jgi:hypothetical protein